MENLINADLFDADERVIINRASEGIRLSDFTRVAFLANLNFARAISTEQEVVVLLDGLISKLSRISDGEWDSLKALVPFDVPFDSDNVALDDAV